MGKHITHDEAITILKLIADGKDDQHINEVTGRKPKSADKFIYNVTGNSISNLQLKMFRGEYSIDQLHADIDKYLSNRFLNITKPRKKKVESSNQHQLFEDNLEFAISEIWVAIHQLQEVVEKLGGKPEEKRKKLGL